MHRRLKCEVIFARALSEIHSPALASADVGARFILARGILYEKKERHAAQAPVLSEQYRDPVSGILNPASST
jgi:hypothetical protein